MRCLACLGDHSIYDPCPTVVRMNVVQGKPHITRWRGRWRSFSKLSMPREHIKAAQDHVERLSGLA